MDNLRKNPPMKFGNYDVTAVRDYLKDEIVNVKTGEKKPTGIPKSNVLYFELTEDAWLCVRPSGTEPKIKLYFGVVGKDLADADEKSEKLAVIVKDSIHCSKIPSLSVDGPSVQIIFVFLMMPP